jgi:ribonuclease H2 subunit A
MSHKAAMDMIRELLRLKVKVKEVFVDTVGDPAKYQSKLSSTFSFTNIKFTVSKKADSLFKCVSAASIVAKVGLEGVLCYV